MDVTFHVETATLLDLSLHLLITAHLGIYSRLVQMQKTHTGWHTLADGEHAEEERRLESFVRDMSVCEQKTGVESSYVKSPSADSLKTSERARVFKPRRHDASSVVCHVKVKRFHAFYNKCLQNITQFCV